jgi:uncharacterized protein (TIGR03437 family)
LSVARNLNKIDHLVIRLTLLVCCLTVSRAQVQVSVLTANYDNGRTNSNLLETTLTPSNVNSDSFGKIGTFPVDGGIFAQALYASGVQIAGKGARNVVFAVTMHNSVYAIDADAPQSTIPLWQVNLGPAVPSSALNITDILPEIGILSTPVIDPKLQVMYVVSDTLENGLPVFRIHALSLADGHEMMNGPAPVGATIAGNGAGSRPDGTLSFDAPLALQRPGLALLNGTVYLSFGSHGDTGNFHGWLIGYDAANLNHRVAVLSTSPNGYGASIWQSGRAPAIDAAGNLYVATGNGDFDGLSNFGESVLKLSGTGLSLLDWYTPDQWSTWNDNDLDLGSVGMILIPNTNLALSGGKSGHLFLINRDSMGHLGPLNTGAVQSVQVNQSGVFDVALWNSPSGPIVYVQESFSSLQAYQIVDGRLNSTKLSETASALTLFAGIAVSANGGTDGTGIVWQTTADFGSYQQPGTLHAFDAADLSHELWNSNMVPSDALGRFVKFVPPTVVNGRVYVPTLSNQLVTYGLMTGGPSETGPPQITAVVNGASFLGDSVSPGELVVIFGANLGPTQLTNLQLDEAGRVTTLLSDTQVFFDDVAVPIVYTSSNQLAAMVPFATSGPNTQVRVMYQDQVSDRFSVAVTPAAPAVFASDGTGGGQGAILNEDSSPNSWDDPADPGSIVVLYATGAGQTDPPGEDGKITSDLPYPKPLLPVRVFIDNQPAEVLYAGAAPGLVQGVLQINARLPAGVAEGGVTVTIQVGDALSPNTIMLVVR